MSDLKESEKLVGQAMLTDANERVRYQHEFSMGGFRALLLINGGAIIGLLTYAGNALDPQSATKLGDAFLSYVIGLASATAAYIFAYFSQGAFLNSSYDKALSWLGLLDADKEREKLRQKEVTWGNRSIFLGTLLVLVSLAAFLFGSVQAMHALIESPGTDTPVPRAAVQATSAPPAKP